MVETKSYTWDCCILTLSARDILAKQNLLEPIGLKPEDAPGIMPEALTPLWMGTDVYATILAVRTDKLGGPAPASWADLWDVAKFPGRRALRKHPIDTLEEALMAYGVPLDESVPARPRPRIRAASTRSSRMSRSGGPAAPRRADAAIRRGRDDPDLDGRAQPAIDAGGPVKIVWNQELYAIESWWIPRGTPRADAARSSSVLLRPAAPGGYTEAFPTA